MKSSNCFWCPLEHEFSRFTVNAQERYNKKNENKKNNLDNRDSEIGIILSTFSPSGQAS